MDDIDKMFEEAGRKNDDGTLTVGETVRFGYYRLLEGSHAGRVIVTADAKIDDERICFFANGLTWTYFEELKDVRCEETYPHFDEPIHIIDRSQATWYGDGSDIPRGYVW
jgi:hypothetical protein